MNWIKALFGILLGSVTAWGQHMLPQQMDTNHYKGLFFISGLAVYGTTSLQNDFSNRLISGGEISSALIQEQLTKHKGINRFGVEISGLAEYHNYQANFLKKPEYGIVVRGGYQSYLSSNYTTDAFGLLFKGNSSYKGDTLDLAGTEFNGMSLQKIGFGFVNKKTKSSFVLNAYNISSYQELFIRKGDFYTDSAGQSVYLNLAGKYEGTTGANFHQGWGVGVDLDYHLPVEWFNKDTAYIQLLASNIGLMQINKATVYRVDHELNYQGYSIANWMNLSNSDSSSTAFQDSLRVDVRDERVVGLLPGFFQVGKLINDADTTKWQSYFGIRKYLWRAYNPLIFIGFQYRASGWLNLGFQGSYGGFSLFKAGAYLQTHYKNFHLGIGSEDLIGLVSGKGRGQNAYLRCVYRW